MWLIGSKGQWLFFILAKKCIVSIYLVKMCYIWLWDDVVLSPYKGWSPHLVSKGSGDKDKALRIAFLLESFYYRKKRFVWQGLLKGFVPTVSEVCILLDCTRFSLGLSINTRGWIIGPAILFVDGKVHINCRSKVKLSLCWLWRKNLPLTLFES